MEFLPKYQFDNCVKRYQGNHRTKSFSCYDQFLSLSFGQLSCRESLRDIVNCLNSQKNFLYHLGFSGNISRSTLSNANENRDWRIYRDLALELIGEARELYRDDEYLSLEIESTCYLVDSSIIELCLNIFRWAKMRTVRAAVKLNMQLDLRGNIPKFFEISSALKHDLDFLDLIEIEPDCYYILDRGYTDFAKLHKIHQCDAFFVIRAKEHLGFKRIYSNSKHGEGIRCDQIIRLNHWLSSKKYPDKLRRIKYFDKESGRCFVYLTNDFNINAEIVANLYKHRWQIELFFKWIKQHLKIKAFWGRSENAVKTQICIAICAYLLVAIARKKLGIEKNLYEILQILNVTLLTKNPLNKLFLEYKLQNFNEQDKKQASLWDY